MKSLHLPGLISYVAMAMWLLQLFISPVHADDGAASHSILANHLDEIRSALIDAGAPADAKITLTAPQSVIAVGVSDQIFIENAAYNASSGRFLMRARGAPDSPTIAISGVAISTVTVPVPARSINRNEPITEADLQWIEITDARAQAFIADADAIIGKVARRLLAVGEPLRKADLASPVLIKRGAISTIVLEAPGIRLTQNAVAAENGGAGDLIAFRNVNSNIEIKAVVMGPNLAKAPFTSRQSIAYLEMDQK